MRHKPKSKMLSLILVICLLLGMLPGMALPVFADNIGANAYGHQAVYDPVNSLYTTVAHPAYVAKGGTDYANLQSLKLFDATNSIWGNVPAETRSDKGKTKTWLSNNNYLLNKFGYRRDGTYKLKDKNGKMWEFDYTSPKIQRQQDTKLFPGNLRVGYKEGDFWARYNFEGLSWQDSDAWSQFGKNKYRYAIDNMNDPKTGNIGNMIDKGDIQYFLAFELDGYNHSCIFCDSYDTSTLEVFGKKYKKQSYEAFNYTKSGPDFGIDKAWNPAKSLTALYYHGDSGHDDKISAKLTNAILVGRDIAGPRVKSIKVTSDREGKNEIAGGAITLDNIGSITDRMVYFQVTWDEPVIFKNLTNSAIANMKLKVQTLGQDGTSGMIADAPFLSFAPAKSDSTQLMTFEYKIPDPYTDSSPVTQERGYFYKFTKAVISKNENEILWNNLYDISGNKFAANKNGQQPAGKVEYPISGTPFVDLKPFAIENIRVNKDRQPDKEFVEQGELLSVTLELNKNFAYETIGTDIYNNYFFNGANYQNFPTITLNIKDKDGKYVTIVPQDPLHTSSSLVKKVFDGSGWVDSNPKQHWIIPAKSKNGVNRPLTAVSINEYKKASEGSDKVYYDVNKVTYNLQLYPDYTLDGDTIKVTNVTSPVGAKDAAGYKLMEYQDKTGILEPINLPSAASGKIAQYKKAMDKNYKLDFVPPTINVSVSDKGSGMIMVKTDISDASLWGCTAAFDIAVEGGVSGKLQYQPSTDGNYDANKWVDAAEGATRIGLSSPISGSGKTRQAYAFIKLLGASEISGVSAEVTVTDEARNSKTAIGKLPPDGGSWNGFDKLAPVVSLTKDGEKAKVAISDMSSVTYSYEWQDTFESDGTTRKATPNSYTGSGSGNAATISYTDTLPPDNKIHYKTLWVKAKDSANNESIPVSMDFSFDKTYSQIIIGGTSKGRLDANDEVKANVTLKNVKRYWYMWLEKPTDYIYKTSSTEIDYGDAAAFSAGEGWGLFGTRFNFWSPNDPNKKVEAAVPNDTVTGSVYSGRYSEAPTTVAGAVYAGLMAGGTYTNTTVLDIKLDYYHTQVVRHEDNGQARNAKWMLRNEPAPSYELALQTIPAKESSRPLVLLIAVEDPSDTTTPGATPGNLRFAAIEFDTFYNKPDIAVRQMRFSTNDGSGNRIDHERQSDNGWIAVNEGLYWPMDKFYIWHNSNEKQYRIQQSQLMINAATFHDFGEAEFYLGADPATGLDRLPDEGIKLELRKELYRAKFDEEVEASEPTKLLFDEEIAKSSIKIQDWTIKKEDLTKAQLFADGYINNAIGSQRDFSYGSKAYRFTVKLDPALVTAVPYAILYDENGEPEVWYVRYSFYAVSDYKGDAGKSEELISNFIFDNTAPSARLAAITHEDGSYLRGGDDMPMGAEAVFKVEGGKPIDITGSIPLVTYTGTSGPRLAFEFYDAGLDINGAMPHTPSPYMPLLLAARDNENSKIGSQPMVRFGTANDLELHQGRVRIKESAESEEFSLAENFLKEKNDFVMPINGNPQISLNEFDSSVIYYQFYDSIRKTESPIYVINMRRDDTPPVVELSVSEPEMPVREVSVKVDGLYDIHPVTAGGITTYVVDTPVGEIKLEVEAWRIVDPGETFNTTDKARDDYYDPDTDFQKDAGNVIPRYVRVKSDKDGVYNFIRNGYMRIVAVDSAGNSTSDLMVNGMKAYTPSIEWGMRYQIKNIDHDPPKFVTEPTWTPDAAAGKFTLSAKSDDTAVAAYIRFDQDYAEFLTGENYGEQIVTLESGETITVPARKPPNFSIGDVPGQLGGSFNPDTGELDLTVYIKYGGGKALKSASLILVDSAGNEVEREFSFGAGLSGIEPKLTNTKTGVTGNVNNYPIYSYGEKLSFSAPAMIDVYNTGFALEHGNLPIYRDGALSIGYVDLFGSTYVEYIYANIFGPGFAHSVKLYAGDAEIDATATINKGITNKDITVRIDTSGTPGLTINGEKQWQATLTQNGSVNYTLTNSSLSQSKSFTLPVSCIDKVIPEANVSIEMSSTVNEETGETVIYSMTYEIMGFNKRNVTVIDEKGNSAPISITFDKSSDSKTYTFRFRDEAGNIGSYAINVSDINFSDPADATITAYRLTFGGSGKDGANILGIYTSGGEPINLGAVNSDIVVKAEALNASGETVPAVMSLVGTAPDGVTVFGAQKSVLFTLEQETEQKVTVKLSGPANDIEVPITLPGGTIDKTPPKATVSYIEDGGNIKVYLIPLSSDIAKDGVSVTGQKGNGIALKLEKDATGHYVDFDTNGSGYFILKDKAGNIGTIAIAVANIDKEPPKLGAEGWSGIIEANSKAATWKADLDRILQTPTNNSIKVFFSFNEQLSKVEVNAYDNSTSLNKLTPTEDYVTDIVSGHTVIIEFKKNCQAQIMIYDIRGNVTTLWRPEDGPITVIDKTAPELEDTYPQTVFVNNKVTKTYKFKNDEKVILLSNPKEGYKNSHTVEFDRNGQYILTFADQAGNVLSQYPQIAKVDELAPHIKMSLGFTGEGKEAEGKDEKGNDFYYTNRDVRIYLNVTDDTADSLTVTAIRQGGAKIEVTKEDTSVEGKSYTHHLMVSENGIYAITAKDKWGQGNTVYANVTMIDKTPPTIDMTSTKAVSTPRNTGLDAVKAAVLQGVTAIDAQSGANEGVTLSVDMSGVDLKQPGSYTAKLATADRLGNESQKLRTVNVLSGDLRVFGINGQTAEANDVFMMTPGKVTISTADASFGGEKVTLYWAQGYKTVAQMKYATAFDGSLGFDASAKGYYTILAQSAERGMYLVYVYVY